MTSGGVSAQVLRGVSRNSAYLIAGQLLSRAVSLLYVLVLARHLGVDEFGTFNLVMSLVLVAIGAIEFGLGRLLVRDLARDAGLIPSYLSTLLPLRGMLSMVGYCVLLTAVWLVGYPGPVLQLTAIAALALLPTSIGLIFDNLFHARQQMRDSAAGDLVVAIVQCGVGTAIVLGGGSVGQVLLAGVLAAVAYLMFLAWRARASGIQVRHGINWRLGFGLLRQAAPFALVTVLSILAYRAELLLLGSLSSAENVGLYSAAAKFSEAALLVPLVLISAAAPVISKAHAGTRDELRSMYLWTLRRLLSVTLPLALAGVLLSEGILSVLLPPEYRQATTVLQWLFCAFPLAAFQMLNMAVLMMSNRSRLMMLSAASMTLAQFAIAGLLISRHGLAGAAWAALLSQAFNVVLTQWCVQRFFVDTRGLLTQLSAPLAAILAGATVAAASATALGPWSALPALAVYGLAFGLATVLRPAPRVS